MLKTFACLVASMTCTATLLGWLDPSEPLPDDTHTYQDIIRLARVAVADGVVIRSDRWLDVEIAADNSSSTVSTLLAARTDSRRRHFLIDSEGKVTRSSRWEDQRGQPPAPHAVRIELAAIDGNGSVSHAQRLSIRALLLAINESLSSDGSVLPVHLQARIDIAPSN